MFSKFARKIGSKFGGNKQKTQNINLDHPTILAPAVLGTIAVMGANTMKNTENDIICQTRCQPYPPFFNKDE